MSDHQRLPRYLRVLAALRSDVLSGTFAQRLPAEMELSTRYAVSRMTLRRAISALVEEGLLEPRQGAGTFVRENAGQARSIGLVVTNDLAANPDDPYHQHVVLSLIYACARRGWNLRVSPNVEDMAVRLSSGRGAPVAGCIAIAFPSDASALLASLPVPIVVIDGEPLPTAPAILPDNLGGTEAAVARLVQLGHREIVHLSGKATTASGRERLQAFLVGMGKAGLPLRDNSVITGHFLVEEGYAAMAAWWSAPVRPTAVLCANDMMAFGAMRWLGEHGITPGRDVSIIGCDGLLVTKLAWPAIATLALDFNAHAEAALQAILEGNRPGIRRTPLQLIERASMGPVPGR